MCCTPDPEVTKKFQSKKKPFTAYKVMHSDGCSTAQNRLYGPGEHVATTWMQLYQRTPSKTYEAFVYEERALPSNYKYDQYHPRGIHAYTNKTHMRDSEGNTRHEVVVMIDPKDVIVAGHGQIVARKITITKEAWKAAGLKLPKKNKKV